jgi:hypothetical protein
MNKEAGSSTPLVIRNLLAAFSNLRSRVDDFGREGELAGEVQQNWPIFNL